MAHYVDFFDGLTQPAEDTDFEPIFNTGSTSSSLQGVSDLSSLSAEAAEIVTWVRLRLGEPIVSVELSNQQIFAAFEEANLTYSSIINTYYAKSWFADLLGLKVNYDKNDLTMHLPEPSLQGLLKYANSYNQYSKPFVGDNIQRGFIRLVPGKQRYKIYKDGYFLPKDQEQISADDSEYSNLEQYMISTGAVSLEFKNFHYYRPSTYGRYVDPYSAFMWLDNYQQGSNNFITALYLVPIWQDILRMSMLKTSDQVRRSDYSYQVFGDEILFIPSPQSSHRIYFEFVPVDDSYEKREPWTYGLTGASLSAWEEEYKASQYITGLQNVPFRDVKYSELNSVARQWIRMYAFGVAQEMLGRVRVKYSGSIEIPGGNLSTDGDSLITEGKERQTTLMDKLKEELEQFTNEAILERKAKDTENLNKVLQYVPLGIFIY